MDEASEAVVSDPPFLGFPFVFRRPPFLKIPYIVSFCCIFFFRDHYKVRIRIQKVGNTTSIRCEDLFLEIKIGYHF